jgi:hypothetical protein
LSGLTDYLDVNLFITGPPETSADTVLAVGLNLQRSVPLGHGILDLFFKNPCGDTLSGKYPGNDMGACFAAYILV